MTWSLASRLEDITFCCTTLGDSNIWARATQRTTPMKAPAQNSHDARLKAAGAEWWILSTDSESFRQLTLPDRDKRPDYLVYPEAWGLAVNKKPNEPHIQIAFRANEDQRIEYVSFLIALPPTRFAKVVELIRLAITLPSHTVFVHVHDSGFRQSEWEATRPSIAEFLEGAPLNAEELWFALTVAKN